MKLRGLSVLTILRFFFFRFLLLSSNFSLWIIILVKVGISDCKPVASSVINRAVGICKGNMKFFCLAFTSFKLDVS